MLHHIYNRSGKENITTIKKELSDGVLYLILIYYQNCQDKLHWRSEDGKLERTDLNLPVAMKGHSSHHVFSIKQLNFFVSTTIMGHICHKKTYSKLCFLSILT